MLIELRLPSLAERRQLCFERCAIEAFERSLPLRDVASRRRQLGRAMGERSGIGAKLRDVERVGLDRLSKRACFRRERLERCHLDDTRICERRCALGVPQAAERVGRCATDRIAGGDADVDDVVDREREDALGL